jgi:hypothetical protein
MAHGIEIDPLDQREVIVKYDQRGRVIEARNDRGEIIIGSDSGIRLWWKTMMEVLGIPVIERTWKKIYIKWKHPKIIGKE